MKNIIVINNLNVFFERPSGTCKHILQDVSLNIKKGKVTCLVGETGSGKTIFMKTLLGLVNGFPGIVTGKIQYNETNILQDIEYYWSYDQKHIQECKSKSHDKFNRLISSRLKNIKGKQIVMIFQNASEHLHPLIPIGKQFKKVLKKNEQKLNKNALNEKIIKLFEKTKISYLLANYDPDEIFSRPLSGGECQRAMIAMNLGAEKNLKLILMDELTTDLDASTRDSIIHMIIELKESIPDLSILFSSHDLDVVKKLADEIIVMKDGKILHQMSMQTDINYGVQRKNLWDNIFNSSKILLHPYTKQLKEAMVRIENGKLFEIVSQTNDMENICPYNKHLSCTNAINKSCWYQQTPIHQTIEFSEKNKNNNILTNIMLCNCGISASEILDGSLIEISYNANIRDIIKQNSINPPILSIQNLSKIYKNTKKNQKKVLDDINLNIYQNKDIAIIGDSGSGKSTLANIIVGLIPYNTGNINFFWDEKKISLQKLLKHKSKFFRRRVQLVFQDCYEAMNKKMTVGAILNRTCQLSGRDSNQIDELLIQLNLNPEEIKYKYPLILSGGEIRRIFIARSFLALSPRPQVPKIMILDEVTRGLDMYVQEIILNFLISKKKSENITYIYISHDLNMIKMMSKVLVITFGGKIWEIALTNDLKATEFLHPYTKYLFDPKPNIRLNPNLNNECPFIPLCDRSNDCNEIPKLQLKKSKNLVHAVACHNEKTGVFTN